MTCERYWREGIVLVERGEDDPHRATCTACMTAHASRQELIEALPLIGLGHTGDPRWQAKVWRRIDDDRVPALGRWRWPVVAMVTVVCVVALWLARSGTDGADGRPRFEVGGNVVAMRSSSIVAGARLRVRVNATSEVWLYRADRLVLRCCAGQQSDACARDPDGMTVDTVLSPAGTYRAFAVEAPAAPPRGGLDEDRAALEESGVRYEERAFLVR